jgi:predicted DNA-binding protein YlxM (UPF0122 family)
MNSVDTGISEKALEIKGFQRGRMDLLRRRLGLLSGRDKVLMTMHVENGISFRQIARLRGVSERSVARRIHQIAERLTDGEYLMCVRNRDKLSQRQIAVARDFFLTGLSMTQIAGKRGMSLYAVRKELADIHNLVTTAGPASSQC